MEQRPLDPEQASPSSGFIQLDTEMSPGEQASLTGVLAMVKPKVSLEIGTYQGGSLMRIAAYSGHVHTFDLVSHVETHLSNVDYHLGDSAVTVPQVLSELAREGVAVDFVLVDGDHSRHGAYLDACNVFDSPATADAVILFHDIANEGVRAAVQDALKGRDFRFVDLSFAVSAQAPPLLGECWGGIGLVARGGALWPHPPQVRANAGWPTTIQPGLLWRALAPVREAKRWAIYRLRPLIRRRRGVRGAGTPAP
ncbi:MAG TPA: class I SAM-dependent methyltransferase [Solirubrobacterales bacterium]|nr:class I SAM-dependent methyltransferase [Solirubrobacterales bacterium]